MNHFPHRAARWASAACAATIAVFAVLAGSATPASAQPAAAAVETPEKVASIEGITEYRLKNGCKLILFPDEASSTITVNMTIFVGSRFEGYGETGMAHLLEHMLFKGSKNFPKADQILSQFGGEYNGSTWTDRTNYYETMAATDKNLDLAIRFEADRLVNCFVKREDLLTEMTVVRNEFEMGENNPDYILSQRLYSAAFEWHNYGKSTIGNRADIERVPIDRLQAFYRTYYQPDNCMLIIAGKFDPAKALKLAAQHFGTIKTPDRELNKTYTEEPPQDGERVVTLRRVGKVAAVGAIYHIPAAAHPDNAAFEVLGLALGMHPAGRLYKALVETKKATDVQTNVTNWHDPGVFEVGATVTGNTKPEEVRDIVIDLVENLKKQPITQDEVDRAVKNYLSHQEQALAKSKEIAINLSEWAGAGDWRLLFIHRDRIAKIKRRRRQPASGRRKYLVSLEPDRRHVPADGEAVASRRSRGAGRRCPRRCLQGGQGDGGGRGVRSDPREHRSARQTSHALQRHEGRAASEEDARRIGGRHVLASLRQREIARRQDDGGQLRRLAHDARHREEVAPGDPRRARQADLAARDRQQRRRAVRVDPYPPRQPRRRSCSDPRMCLREPDLPGVGARGS